jgi:hypothetical protein
MHATVRSMAPQGTEIVPFTLSQFPPLPQATYIPSAAWLSDLHEEESLRNQLTHFLAEQLSPIVSYLSPFPVAITE